MVDAIDYSDNIYNAIDVVDGNGEWSYEKRYKFQVLCPLYSHMMNFL